MTRLHFFRCDHCPNRVCTSVIEGDCPVEVPFRCFKTSEQHWRKVETREVISHE